jgi:hypothetical protein
MRPKSITVDPLSIAFSIMVVLFYATGKIDGWATMAILSMRITCPITWSL